MNKEKKINPELRFSEFRNNWIENELRNLEIYVADGNYGELYPKATQFNIDGIPFIRVNNIRNGRIVWNDMKFINLELHEVLKSGHLKTNDVLVSTRGEIGLVAYVTEQFDNANINAQLCLLRSNSVNTLMLFYYLQSAYGQVQFKRLQTGSALKQLPKGNLSSLKINLPSIEEQVKIATFLSLIDRKIDLLEKKTELLEQQKRGLLQKIFSQEIRFRKNDGSNFDKWFSKKLSETVTYHASNLSQSFINEQNKGIYKVYGAIGLIGTSINYIHSSPYISIVKDGAGVGRVQKCEAFTSCTSTLGALINSDDTNIDFIYYLINTIDFKKFIVGSTIPHIYFKDYGELKVEIPSLEEQKHIVNFLVKYDLLIDNIKVQIEKTEELKRGLLQKMFV